MMSFWMPLLSYGGRCRQCDYSISVTAVSLGIDRLSRDERLALVPEIWDSLAFENQSPFLNDAQRQELARLVTVDDANPDM